MNTRKFKSAANHLGIWVWICLVVWSLRHSSWKRVWTSQLPWAWRGCTLRRCRCGGFLCVHVWTDLQAHSSYSDAPCDLKLVQCENVFALSTCPDILLKTQVLLYRYRHLPAKKYLCINHGVSTYADSEWLIKNKYSPSKWWQLFSRLRVCARCSRVEQHLCSEADVDLATVWFRMLQQTDCHKQTITN